MQNTVLHPLSSPSRSLSLFLCSALLVLCAPQQGSAQADPNQPIYLVTSYRCATPDRTAFLRYMRTTGVNNFDAWKRNGTVADYQILFNSFVDSDTWDMMVVLKFNTYADSKRWYAVADTMPGGLDAAGLALGQPFSTVISDVGWSDQAATPADPKEAIYFVIPYEYQDKAIYMRYFGVYVLPQLMGWMKEGIMSSYKIFVNNHATGDIWDILFVLEYRDLANFGRRDEVKWSVREQLVRDNPAWKLIHDMKHSVRTEGRTTISQAIVK